MNLLFVTQALPYLPAQDGFRLYAANLLREFGRRHQVDLISLLQEDDRRHMDWCQEHCASVTTFLASETSAFFKPFQFAATYGLGRPLHPRRKVVEAIRRGFAERRWEVMHVEGGYVAGLIPDGLPIPKILSLHDSWKVRCEQMSQCSPSRRERSYYRILSRVEPCYERFVYPRFDRCVVVAESDARAVRKTVPGSNVAVISNGIDTDYFRPLPAKAPNLVLTFHGNLSYAPNVEAAVNFAEQVLPLIRAQSPAVSFHLVGARPVEAIAALARRPGITLSADLPDLREAVGSARVYVCPIRHGSGVKNKLLEAMAMGLPIVCYPESAAGIDGVPGTHLLIARDAEMFANAVQWLLRNPERSVEMARAALALVQQKYSWGSRSRAFEDIYKQVLMERGASGDAQRRRLNDGWPRKPETAETQCGGSGPGIVQKDRVSEGSISPANNPPVGGFLQ
jgi:glycosyltransferase involved in cell wall biosynthesis